MNAIRYGDRLVGLGPNGELVDYGPAPDFNDPREVLARKIATIRAAIDIDDAYIQHGRKADRAKAIEGRERHVAGLEALLLEVGV